MGVHLISSARRSPALLLVVAVTLVVALAVTVGGGSGQAQVVLTPVPLGTAEDFAVLAGTTVTNDGPTMITGNLGLSPGSAVDGFPPGTVAGAIHVGDDVADQAKVDLVTAYDNAADRTPFTVVPVELGGQQLVGGVYRADTLQVTGTLTLDAQDNPDAVFVFQAASTLITASASTVSLINGADPCNVFWQVGSSATLGTGSVFVGTLMTLTSITATTGAAISGRLLARNGAVTLDTNVITRPECAPLVTTTTTTTGTTTGTTTTTTRTTTTTTTTGTTTTGTTTTTTGTTTTTTTTDTGTGSPTPATTTTTVTGTSTNGAGTTSGAAAPGITSSSSGLPITGAPVATRVMVGAVTVLLGGLLLLAAALLAPRAAHRRRRARR